MSGSPTGHNLTRGYKESISKTLASESTGIKLAYMSMQGGDYHGNVPDEKACLRVAGVTDV